MYGLGGRDVLIGGDPQLGPFDNDTFYFTKFRTVARRRRPVTSF